MRSLKITVLLAIFVLLNIPVWAFYPRGEVNKDVAYQDLELIKQPYSIRVTGTLRNKTNRPIRLSGRIMFVTIHKDVLNSAHIYETIPPYGSVQFNKRLEKNNFKQIKHCYKVAWEIRDYTLPPIKSRKRRGRSSVGYSNTRKSGGFIQVAGNGTHHSDPFELKAGLYIVKSTHTGNDNCIGRLLYGDGRFAAGLINGIGYTIESRPVRIEEDGYYLLAVTADGGWTINMEYQKPKDVDRNAPQDNPASPETTGSRETLDPILIRLNNGRIIKADTYWEEGDQLKVSIYNGIMSVNKKDVDEIIGRKGDN